MALLKCPECNKEFSEYATACPNCGCPIDIVKQHLQSTSDAHTTPTELVKESNEDLFQSSDINSSFDYIHKKNAADIKDVEIPLVEMVKTERILFYIIAVFVFFTFFIALINLRIIPAVLLFLSGLAILPKNKILEFWDNRNLSNPKITRILTSIGLFIAAVVISRGMTAVKEGANVAVTQQSAEKITENSDINTATTDEIVDEPNLDSKIADIENAGYYYITPDDLSTYCPNLEGVKIYTVINVDELDNEKIQSTLVDGYMMSNFYTSEDVTNNISEDDVVAVYGTVADYNSYGSIGTSVNINDCEILAVGDDASSLKREASSENLADYSVVTPEVANNNNISEEDYKALCETVSYNDVLRNPDDFDGKYIKVSGTVDQIIEGLFDSVTIYVKDSSGNKWDCYYYYNDGESHILEGDYITVYGKCDGTSTSTTVLGKQVTLPNITLEYIE